MQPPDEGHRAAFQAAIALHGGIIVDDEETAGWWPVQDYSFHAFAAAVVLVRVAADHTGRSVRSFARRCHPVRRTSTRTVGRAPPIASADRAICSGSRTRARTMQSIVGLRSGCGISGGL